MARMHTPSTASALVSDRGDDHELGEEFVRSLARAGDRLTGFAAGVCLIALSWALWLMV